MENSSDLQVNEEISKEVKEIQSNQELIKGMINNKMIHWGYAGSSHGNSIFANFVDRFRSLVDCSEYASLTRIYVVYVFNFITCRGNDALAFHSLPGAKLSEWRNGFLITTKERRLKDLKSQIVKEVSQSKYEFVTDHELQILVFDRVMDSGGTFML